VSRLLRLSEKLQIWRRQDPFRLKATYIMDVIYSICAVVEHSSENYYTTTGIISLIESYNLKPVAQKSGLPFRMASCIWHVFCCNLVWLLLVGLLRITLSL
jgi:hypothetical protein